MQKPKKKTPFATPQSALRFQIPELTLDCTVAPLLFDQKKPRLPLRLLLLRLFYK